MSNYGFTSAGTSYDDEDRLTGFARASGTFTQSWSLTSVGDWNSITTNGTAQNRTHGPTHELLTAGGQNVTTDVKGNITLLPTTLTTSGVAMAVGYDFDNKLKSADVDNNGSNDVTFQYDALGRRVARQGTSGSFVYVQHDQQTIADYGYGDAPSSPTHRYVYASYIDEPVVRKAAGTSGTIHYYQRNQQYSITAVTTSSGSVAERYAYTAYGQPTILDGSGSVLSSSAINNRYTYTGREWDQSLGLYHFRARWMSGLAGRFMERDPSGFEGSEWGLFEFCEGSPTGSRSDPFGLQSITIGDSYGEAFTVKGVIRAFEVDVSQRFLGKCCNGLEESEFNLSALLKIGLGLEYGVKIPMVGTIEFKAELVSANLKVGGKCKTGCFDSDCCRVCGSFFIDLPGLLPVQGGASLLVGFDIAGKATVRVTACYNFGNGCKYPGFDLGICIGHSTSVRMNNLFGPYIEYELFSEEACLSLNGFTGAGINF